VRPEGWHIAVKTGGVEAEVEFKLLKRSEATFLLAQTWSRPLRYTSLSRRWGCQWRLRPRA